MELSGTLHQFPLRELLCLMQDSMLCGDLEINGRYGTAVISSRDGLLRHAAYMNKSGFAALWMIFEEPSTATFTVRTQRELQNESLIGDARLLSDEGEYRAEQWQPLRSMIPHDSVVPTVVAGATPAKTLEAYDRVVFQAIDGHRSLVQIASELVMEVIDVARAVARMVEAGIVRLPKTAPVFTPTPHVTSSTSAPAHSLPKGGLLKRLATIAAR